MKDDVTLTAIGTNSYCRRTGVFVKKGKTLAPIWHNNISNKVNSLMSKNCHSRADPLFEKLGTTL